MNSAGALAASRVLVVGTDADVSVALHLHLERAGFALYCVPAPTELEAMLRAVAPHVVVLLLPAAPDASWGSALTAAQSAARVGVRVMVVAPSREIVEPLAAVAGAERALARAEVLSRPLSVVERASPRQAAAPPPAPPPTPSVTAPVPRSPSPSAPALGETDEHPLRAAPQPNVDLMALIDEELVEERPRPQNARVEVSVSLVSEHNFFVGVTRRIDSGGVFIASSMPPPVGTRVQVRLGLADGRKIDLDGEVAFIRSKSATTGRQPPGCGVRLQNLPGWAVDAIERFFLARQPIVYSPT
ncbi:MAG TPA: PilZ domain-containing protein [Anaeromyxobacteraceae bacterium]|nr:PilZ domain-containing protein [Anaeromyxobacteraceae bacterium]